MNDTAIEKGYSLAKERYAELGVNVEAALRRLRQVPISMQCWQGDDVAGYERVGELTGGIVATGNYPGRARTADELRADAAKALSLIPGKHRFSLHAIYLETGGKQVERNEIGPEHFRVGWTGPRGWALGWTSIRRSFPIRRPPTARSRTATSRFAGFGSSTASLAARSARRSAAA